MPELPEVETIRRGLAQIIVGKTISGQENYNSPKSFPNTQADVAQFMISATVREVRRRAKVLLIDLSSEYTLVIHLKMTGQLVFIPSETSAGTELPVSGSPGASGPSVLPRFAGKAKPSSASSTPASAQDERFGGGHPSDSFIHALPDNTTRQRIDFGDGSHLYFNDLRKFGWIKLYPSIEVSNIDFMQRVGPEPLEEAFTNTEFISRVRRRNGTTIKAAILDQTVLAGVGNIYADESLWGAKIHPATRVREVSDNQLATLLEQIKFVMNLSIEKGGSTDKNYVDAEGKKGSYLAFANVFRREGKPCQRHPDVLIEKSRVAGRGTHVCPVCQPVPKYNQ